MSLWNKTTVEQRQNALKKHFSKETLEKLKEPKMMSEEFEKWKSKQCLTEALDREDLEFIENDDGDQFVSLNEVDRATEDVAERAFQTAYSLQQKKIDKLNEIVKMQGEALELVSRLTDGVRYELEASVYSVEKDEYTAVFSARDIADQTLKQVEEMLKENWRER